MRQAVKGCSKGVFLLLPTATVRAVAAVAWSVLILQRLINIRQRPGVACDAKKPDDIGPHAAELLVQHA